MTDDSLTTLAATLQRHGIAHIATTRTAHGWAVTYRVDGSRPAIVTMDARRHDVPDVHTATFADGLLEPSLLDHARCVVQEHPDYPAYLGQVARALRGSIEDDLLTARRLVEDAQEALEQLQQLTQEDTP